MTNNQGAIPPNVLDGDDAPLLGTLLKGTNTRSDDQYQLFCREHEITPHPARMPPELAEFFIRFLTDENDLVLDPFAGSNTTGAVAQKAGAALDLVRSRLGLCVLLDRLVCNGRDKKSIEQS